MDVEFGEELYNIYMLCVQHGSFSEAWWLCETSRYR
jgi:hypothetical protein